MNIYIYIFCHLTVVCYCVCIYRKMFVLVLCVIWINNLTLALPAILLGLLENCFLKRYCLVIVQFLSSPPHPQGFFGTLPALPRWFCLFCFELLPSSLCEAEWLSVFHCATPWPVGVFGNNKVVGSNGYCPPVPLKGDLWGFPPGAAAYWPLSSMAVPPTRMFIKEEILSH